MLLAPVVRRQKGEFRDVFERLAREGFVRVRVDGELVELGENVARIKLDKKKFHNIEAVVDRLVIDDKIRVRLGDSVETALRWGEGVMFTLHQLPGGESVAGRESPAQSAPQANQIPAQPRPQDPRLTWIETLHSNKMCSPATGKSFDPPTPKHFSFNAPAGACPVCHGLGQKMVFDEHLVVPDPESRSKAPSSRGGARASG
jgi:excinuclease ABC subunit A